MISNYGLQYESNQGKSILSGISERDESKVAHHRFCSKEMDTVYTLDEATLFDFFFHYLGEIEVFPLLEELDPETQGSGVPEVRGAHRGQRTALWLEDLGDL